MISRALAFALALAAVGCNRVTDKSPLDTDTDTVDTDTVDTDTVDTDETDVDTDETDATDVDTDPPTDELVVVSEVSVPSAYFSGGGVGESFTTTENTACAQRAPNARGSCFQVVFNRDPDSDGSGPTFWGGFFLDPANDPGTPWENGPAVDLGEVAGTVTFYAWGDPGRVVNFKSGLGGEPGGEINRDVTLTATPTLVTLNVRPANRSMVNGVFGFAIVDGPTNNTPVTFYFDDVVYNPPPPPAGELIVVSDVAVPSAYFSDGNGALGESFTTTENTACTVRAPSARGACFQIVYNRDPDSNGSGPSFWGGYFLDPANNPGTPWENGPAVQLGGTASTVTFYAWGDAGRVVNFKAGLGGEPGGEINRDVTLSATPTLVTLDVSANNWTEINGVFGFGIGDSAPLNNQTFTFYIDDIVWN